MLNGMNEKDVVTWTTLINGYVVNGDAKNALILCRTMQLEGVKPNLVSVTSLLSACGDLVSLRHGKCLHAWAIRQNLESEVVVETTLVDMYAKCNDSSLSYKVFMKTSKKRTAPWNAVLSGFVHNKLARNAVQLFKQMLAENVRPDSPTLNSLLPAYAILADLKQAINIHCYLIRLGFLCKLEVASMLVDIYSKCGSLGYAHQVFDIIPPKDKDIIIWSAIIAAYGKHGHGEMVVSLFYQMVQSGEKPNEVTFTSVLHACSHAGLVDEGLSLFNLMLKKYQVIPRVDHYTCIVDLLGRAGRLNDAYNLIRIMPITHNHAIWGALLGACVIHENVELGEVAARWTFELKPGIDLLGPVEEITSVAFGIPFRHSITDSSSQSTKPFSARKSPKLQIQHSSDLPFTLTRVGQMLTVKELNTAFNHFGNSNKFNNISQLIAGCVKVKDGYPKTLELIQELQGNNLRMDDVIYGAVLAVCASNGKWEEAECYFKQMKSEGRSPNVYHYSSLLNAYSACGNFQKADVLIQDMKSEGLVPNQVILTTLLKVYVRGGFFEKSRELVAELESSGYAEDEMPYCVLMDGLSKAGQIHEAKVIFDKMMKKQVRSDGYAHSIMISAFCRAKLFQEAKQLAKDFQTTFNKYDVVIMNSMLCAFCRVGEMDSVVDY